ncbi:Protein trichome birefringence [Rhynchospora pubera]|uniref:Protein trichome birefringence n=1 Tax=Rhynchospora pubera TaxID=906938 RepID=A0AAV8H800_9POAL|nr:Protein trichome birefringence [Rhynchospora pubera]
MGKPQNQTKIIRKLTPCVLYTLIPLALLHYYTYISPHCYNQIAHKRLEKTADSDSITPPVQGKAAELKNQPRCDYSDGHWVQTTAKPLYNGTSCGTIKWAQNCMVNGRPDTGYLYWQWQPEDNRCPAPLFDASVFLEIIKNKHIAFIGDSLARNQVESLICLLSTASKPELVYQGGDDLKFRRWVFYEYNVTLSSLWSQYLVKGTDRNQSEGIDHNTLYLDTPNEKWASELDKIDIVVFHNGHWFVQKAIYYGEGNQLLGCNFAQEINCTDYNIFDAFRKVLRTSLKEVTKRFYKSDKTVVVATFTLAHFEGEWKFGTCLKTEPNKEGDAEMPHLENEMRKLAIEEVARAVKDVKEMNGWLRIEALDVTKLTFLRPDGHPGPYMFPNPFANGIKEGVPNDCVHWCMPGPIDTWNAILLELMKRWKDE